MAFVKRPFHLPILRLFQLFHLHPKLLVLAFDRHPLIVSHIPLRSIGAIGEDKNLLVSTHNVTFSIHEGYLHLVGRFLDDALVERVMVYLSSQLIPEIDRNGLD
jgi:hypothetical protein